MRSIGVFGVEALGEIEHVSRPRAPCYEDVGAIIDKSLIATTIVGVAGADVTYFQFVTPPES
jgi:hypothetical protein